MIQPQYNPTYAPNYPATGASAVNIQIFEPKAYGSAPQQPQMPQYDNQFYQYPQGSMYYPYPGAPCYPPYCPQPQMPQYPQYPQYPQQPQAPAMPEPPVMPPPVIEQPPQPAAQTPAAPQAPEAPQAPMPEVKQAQQPQNIIDIARVNQELNSQDLNQQTEVITKIAQMSQADPSIALQLVEEQVMRNLGGIIQRDTNQLPGPTDAQVKAAQKLQKGEKVSPEEQQLIEQLSPKEIAEKNKVFSMFTLAILQKLQRDEVDQFNAQSGGAAVQPPQLQNLVGFNEIVNATQTSTIPAVRAAGIQAISHVARPEDAQVVQQLLSPFLNDQDASVKQVAQEALAKLLGTPAPAQAA